VRKRAFWLFALMIVLAAGPAFAQGGAGSTGSIQGEVVDESGAVLPGVTVTATGATLLGSQTATTNAQGIYRFLGLPAGTYKLAFEMPGFGKVVRDDIRLGIGFTSTVNTKMAVKQLQEEVTVTGESTTIDTAATRVQQNFDKGMLDSLPNARDMWSLLGATPAVQLRTFDVGGSSAGTQTGYVAYGNGGQNRPLIEGINTTEGTAAAGFYFDYGSFDEVIVGTAGNSAEMPSGGVLTNFIGKGGGNRFSGEVYYEFEDDSFLQSTNLTQGQLDRGYANLSPAVIQQLGLKRNEANTLLSYKNLNASVGGPIMKDKLWFWAGVLRQENVVYQPPNGAILDGTGFQTKLMNYTGKLTYQITPKDKLIGYLQYGIKQQPYRLVAFVGGSQNPTKDATSLQDSPSWVGKLEYNRTFGDRGFLEVRAGEFGYNFGLIGNDQTNPRVEDRSTLAVRGGGYDWELDRRRKQLHGAYTFFADNKLGGNHQVKVGGEYQHETGRERFFQYWTGNVLQVLNNGAPDFVRLGLTTDSWNGLDNYGLFLNDSYVRNRFTLNVGLRFDRYRLFLPEQERPASRFSPQAQTFAAVDNIKTFNHVVPRLGVIFDITGNGKTVWKANFGRYFFNPGVNLASSANPNTGEQYTEYAWNDTNGDRLWQQGEQGAVRAQFGGTASISVDPNLRNSYTDEFSTWLERDLGRNIGARVGFVWKMDRDGYQQENRNRPLSAWTVPATVTDIGPDGLANSGDERTVSAFGLNPANAALPVENYIFNQPGFTADYQTLEIGATKRFSNKWNLVTSYSITWYDAFGTNFFGTGTAANYGSGATFTNVFGTTGMPITPNGLASKSQFSQWNFKLHGSYEPGWGLRLTPVFRMQQGYPYGRSFNTAVGGLGQNFLGEPYDTRRVQNYKQLDFRAEKKFNLTSSGRAKLGVLFDLFNVFNANSEYSVRGTTGRLTVLETGASIPQLGTPLTILPPRIARVSARLEW
jgi:hypothetical protein